jgi:AcrR family transcriptional regulator
VRAVLLGGWRLRAGGLALVDETVAFPGDGDCLAAGLLEPAACRAAREVVLATALELIDRDGAEALSMRRLAGALAWDTMILCRHVPNKAALLDGVAEIILAQLTVDPADPDWAGQLRTVARGYHALALAHPHVVPLLVTRPLATPLALRPRGTLRRLPLEVVPARHEP